MKHVVSFSGGRTSAYLVHKMEIMRKQKSLDVEYIFMDTGCEHPKTYEFIRKVVELFDIELTCIRAQIHLVKGKGVTYEIVDINDLKYDTSLFARMMEKHGNPYVGGAFCTSRLKTEPHDKYVNEKYGRGNYNTWLGIRADEPTRLREKKNFWYLADISDFTKEDVLDWWGQMPFDLEIPEWLGNCVFCIKKGINKVALAAKQEPERAAEWVKVTTADSVRKKLEKDGTPIVVGAIYRGKLTMEGVAKMYEDHSEQDIIRRLRGTKTSDSGCGSESCEAYGGDEIEEEVNFY